MVEACGFSITSSLALKITLSMLHSMNCFHPCLIPVSTTLSKFVTSSPIVRVPIVRLENAFTPMLGQLMVSSGITVLGFAITHSLLFPTEMTVLSSMTAGTVMAEPVAVILVMVALPSVSKT